MGALHQHRPRGGLARLAAATALGLALAPSLAAQAGVTHVRIDGPLDRGTQALLRRAIDRAETEGQHLIVELDTPGGDVELMWQMANALLRAEAHTTAWVNDQALSAGALLAMACELLYMRPHATIGSALPVQIGVGGLMPVSEDEQVREKLLSVYRSEFRGIAAERGRPEVLAESMVDPGIEVVEVEVDGVPRLISDQDYDDLRQRGEQARFVRTVVAAGELFNASGREAVTLGLADGLADSLEEVVGKLSVGPAEPVTVLRTRSEDLAGLLHVWSPLLLILAFVLAYVEFKMPGFGIAGIGSIACFAIVLFGRWLIGLADIPHIILITVGMALVAAELFLAPGTIWFGLVGGLCVLFGLIWSFAGAGIGFAYPLDREILLDESLRVMGSAFIAMLCVWALGRVLPKTPGFQRLVLDAGSAPVSGAAMPEASGAHARVARVGAAGRALTDLRPVGKVVLAEDETVDFEARATGPGIDAGAAVVVVEVRGTGRLLVEAARSDPETAETETGTERA